MNPPVRIRGVSKTFGATTALRDFDLQLEPGRVYGLLGPNGSGKTTAIRLMLGLLAPNAGTVSLFGGAPDAAARRRVGYVPEQRGLLQDLTVHRHLAYFAELYGASSAQARATADRWAARLGLTERSRDRVKALSKGNQQKVQLALALLHRPALLILDEPYTGLDPMNQEVIEEAIQELVATGTAVALSTHQLAKAEASIQHVVVVVAGRKVIDADLALLRRERSEHRSLHDLVVAEISAGGGDVTPMSGETR